MAMWDAEGIIDTTKLEVLHDHLCPRRSTKESLPQMSPIYRFQLNAFRKLRIASVPKGNGYIYTDVRAVEVQELPMTASCARAGLAIEKQVSFACNSGSSL